MIISLKAFNILIDYLLFPFETQNSFESAISKFGNLK